MIKPMKLLSMRSTRRAGSKALARSIALGLVGTMLMLSPAQALAKNSSNKKPKDQQAVERITALIGANFDDLAGCLDAMGFLGARECFEALPGLTSGPEIIVGFGFAIAAIIKFKAHKDNPGNGDLDALAMCLLSNEDPQVCTLTLDTRLQRLALLLQSYRELRPYCGAPDVLCDRPVDWPSAWPWPFPEHGRRSRH